MSTGACPSPEGRQPIPLLMAKEIFDLVRDDLAKVEQELAAQSALAAEANACGRPCYYLRRAIRITRARLPYDWGLLLS
jgi:hypothetical protein